MKRQEIGRRVAMAVLLLAVAVIAAGCGGAPEAAEPPPAAEPTAEPDPGTDPPEDPVEEIGSIPTWSEAFSLPLPNGWVLRECEGDRTTVCLWDGDAFLGDIEIAGPYPLTAEQQQLPDADLLATWAGDFVEQFRADRARGCPDFRYEADEATPASLAGAPALRSGFTLVAADGTVVERVVNHFAVHDGAVWLVNTDAYAAEGGCLERSEVDASFSPADLADLEPLLDGLLAQAPIPAVP